MLVDIEYIVWRILQQALDEAVPMYWERRALDFERYPCDRNNLIALACRRHAWVLRDMYRERYAERGIQISPEVHGIISEVA